LCGAAFSACTRTPQAPARYAFLPFDNLTGDAALDWLTRTAPRIAAAEVAGTAHTASSIGDAYLERANRFVHGYFTKQGSALRLSIEVEDAATHKMIATPQFDGAALASIAALARSLEPKAGEFSSSNAEAVAAWGQGDFEKAVGIDPAFGAAWLSLMEAKARAGDNAGAIEASGRALSHPVNSDVDAMRIELARATLKDDARAEHDALLKLTAKVADPRLLENLGALETKAREFALAEGDYKKILAAEPDNAEAVNLLGYALGFQGKVSEAEATFAAYRKMPGQEANSFDSLGEVYFMNGKFADAEKAFLHAHELNAAFLSGGDLRKAAYARWLSGDLPGADAIFAKYADFKTKLHDPALEWERAQWLYCTMRKDAALAQLAKSPPPQSVVQAKVWRGEIKLPSDPAQWKKAYEATNPTADGLFRALYAEALAAAGNREEAKKLVARWPLPDNAGDAVLQSLVFPKFIALRRMLNL
jgi:tetratricopeptide (TPR) repeat protein